MGDIRTTRSTVVVAADGAVTLPAAPSVGSGWPSRTGRLGYVGGLDMRDERRTVNPTQEVNAMLMNLLYWQAGAMGLNAPKAVISYAHEGDVAPMLLYAAFVWDQTVYRNIFVSSAPSYFTTFINGVGDITFNFDASVPGRLIDGVAPQVPLDFSSAHAHSVGDINIFGSPVEVEMTSATSIRIRSYAGAPRVPSDISFSVELF